MALLTRFQVMPRLGLLHTLEILEEEGFLLAISPALPTERTHCVASWHESGFCSAAIFR